MKTNVIMKIAVVFMAAFGAYAFSGNANEIDQFSYKDSGICTAVTVLCSNEGNYTCRVKLQANSNIVDVWDLQCMQLIKHNTPAVLDEF